MFKTLFLILVAMSSIVFAQNSDDSSTDKKAVAKLFSEFGKVTNGQIRSEMDSFLVEVQNNPPAQGYIINYGKRKDVSTREKLLRNHITLRRQDASRIVFVNGGFEKQLRTQLWLVPYGAESPKISENKDSNSTPKSVKVGAFGKVSERYFESSLDKFSNHLNKDKTLKGVVINYAGLNETEEKSFAVMEKRIRDYPKLSDSVSENRIIFIRGKPADFQQTQLWIVPANAEIPTVESLSIKFDEFGKLYSGDMKARLDNFFVQLHDRPGKKGYVITKGSAQDVATRERFIRNYISFRAFDSSRIELKKDGFSSEINTELWIDL